jgi:PTS system nitrogen regulatory IIA component
MTITEFLPQASVVELTGTSASGVLAELCKPFAGLPGLEPDAVLKALLAREALGSTGVGDGFAIPHGRVPGLPGLTASFGRSAAGVDFRAVDQKPVHLFFALVVPVSAPGPYLNALALVSRLFKSPEFRAALLAASDGAEVHRLLLAEAAK